MKTYKEITELIPMLQGWCDVSKAITLYNIVQATKPDIAIEIGTWGGRSAFPVALALRDIANECAERVFGKLICVDPWTEQASVEGQVAEADKNWWGDPNVNHEMVYQDFVHHRRLLGLEQIIEVQRVKSDDYNPPKLIDYLHVDGNHGPQAYTDTVKYAARLSMGGICILDDIGWSGGNVERAAGWLTSNGFIELHKLGTGACYLRLL